MANPETTPHLVEAPPDSSGEPNAAEPEVTQLESTPEEEPARESRFSKLVLLVIVVLLVALFWTGFNLRSETLKSAALEANVATLEAEVAQAEATVSAHQERLDGVRVEVGELLSRVGSLNSLVNRDVVAEDTLRVPFAPKHSTEAFPAD